MYIVKEMKDTWIVIGEFATENEARMFKLAQKRRTGNPTRIYGPDGKEVI